MKAIDIDDYLKKQGIEIKLGAKTFTVTDLSMDVKETLIKENKNEKEIVKKILRCNDKDLEGYGLVAFAAIIREVTENLFRTPSAESQ